MLSFFLRRRNNYLNKKTENRIKQIYHEYSNSQSKSIEYKKSSLVLTNSSNKLRKISYVFSNNKEFPNIFYERLWDECDYVFSDNIGLIASLEIYNWNMYDQIEDKDDRITSLFNVDPGCMYKPVSSNTNFEQHDWWKYHSSR